MESSYHSSILVQTRIAKRKHDKEIWRHFLGKNYMISRQISRFYKQKIKQENKHIVCVFLIFKEKLMVKKHKPKKHKNPIKTIREMCVEFMGGGKPFDLIDKCSTNICAMWKFRFGKNPYRKRASESQVFSAKKNLLKMKQAPQVFGHVRERMYRLKLVI